MLVFQRLVWILWNTRFFSFHIQTHRIFFDFNWFFRFIPFISLSLAASLTWCELSCNCPLIIFFFCFSFCCCLNFFFLWSMMMCAFFANEILNSTKFRCLLKINRHFFLYVSEWFVICSLDKFASFFVRLFVCTVAYLYNTFLYRLLQPDGPLARQHNGNVRSLEANKTKLCVFFFRQMKCALLIYLFRFFTFMLNA